jgi:general secretion pathway protein D
MHRIPLKTLLAAALLTPFVAATLSAQDTPAQPKPATAAATPASTKPAPIAKTPAPKPGTDDDDGAEDFDGEAPVEVIITDGPSVPVPNRPPSSFRPRGRPGFGAEGRPIRPPGEARLSLAGNPPPSQRDAVFTGTPGSAAASKLKGSDVVGPILLVDESLPQVISLFEKLSGKMIWRQQTLPVLKINFTGEENITRAQAVVALESLLSINGVAIVQVEGTDFYKAVPMATAALEAPPLYTESTLGLFPSERIISRLFTLKNTTVTVIEPALQGIINRPRGGTLVSMPTTNALLLTDSISAVQKVEKIIATLDVPNNVMIFKVEHIRASDVMKQLRTLQATQGTTALRNVLGGDIAIEADDLANQVIIVSPAQNREKLRQIIEEMDKDSLPKTVSEIISLKHTDAAAVFKTLSGLVTGSTAGAASNTNTNTTNNYFGGGAMRGGGGNNFSGVSTTYNQYQVHSFSTRANSPGSSGTGGNRSGMGGNAATFPTAVASTNAPNSYSRYLDVVADERSNSLIVVGTANDMKQIRELVAKIDTPLAQVRIEAIIVEITLSTGEASGLDTLGLGYKTTLGSGASTLDGNYKFNASMPSNPLGGRPPFAVTGSLKDFSLEMVFNKAEANSRVRILSAPLISTSHNQAASIFVGQTRPVVTGTINSTYGGASSSSTVESKRIGLQLDVTPRVGADGSVEMKVTQSNETLAGSIMVDGNEQPITAQRSASSYLIAEHNETVVLAGLQSYRELENKGVVWLLGYIPLIGELFKPKTNDTERTELIVFLKPHIIDRTKPGVSPETPGLTPGSLTRVDAQSYVDTGRFNAVSLTKGELKNLDIIRRRESQQAEETRNAKPVETKSKEH